MSAYVIAFISTGAVTAAATLVAITTLMGHRPRLAAAGADRRVQSELAEIQRQIDRGRHGV
ncbi:hypothetical protein ACFVAJ_14200 [Agromyces sp. NPDC057679]|uniref:hypothetical protein n=1 Tax=Agromyces sp. NPDC057679 TaxID=3346207 RepID=UPI0036709505